MILKINMNPFNKGSLYSLLIGGPFGLIAIFLFILLFIFIEMLTMEGPIISLGAIYFVPLMVFAVFFLPALWYAGRFAALSLLKKEKLLLVSFNYCALTNAVCWIPFMMTCLLREVPIMFSVLIPVCFFLSGVLISTFTVGLFICWVIKRKLISAAN